MAERPYSTERKPHWIDTRILDVLKEISQDARRLAQDLPNWLDPKTNGLAMGEYDELIYQRGRIHLFGFHSFEDLSTTLRNPSRYIPDLTSLLTKIKEPLVQLHLWVAQAKISNCASPQGLSLAIETLALCGMVDGEMQLEKKLKLTRSKEHFAILGESLLELGLGLQFLMRSLPSIRIAQKEHEATACGASTTEPDQRLPPGAFRTAIDNNGRLKDAAHRVLKVLEEKVFRTIRDISGPAKLGVRRLQEVLADFVGLGYAHKGPSDQGFARTSKGTQALKDHKPEN